MKLISESELMITPKSMEASFTEEVTRMAGLKNIRNCIQCGICAGTCPLIFAFDYSPMQIVRMVLLGMKKKLFSIRSLWLCDSCYTCTSRCPQAIDVALLISSVKSMAIREKIQATIENKPKFHKYFTEIIKKHGRVHEIEIQMRLMKKEDIIGKAAWGLRLWRKGKVDILATNLKEAAPLLTIFENALKEES